MRILIANLKLFCQCVFAWWTLPVLLVFIAPFCLFPDLVDAEVVLAALMLVSLGLGIAIASWQNGVTCRVGLFCLPRPYGERRRLAFFLGLLAAFGSALVFIGCADRFDVPRRSEVLVVASVFSASLFLCFVAAAVPLLAGCLFLGLPLILSGVISLYVPSWPRVSVVLERAIIHHPAGIIALGAIGVVVSSFWLARPVNDLRHYPTRPSTKRDATQRFFADALEASERKDAVQPWINEVLLERMRRSPHTSTAKHVWSSLYLWLHPRGGGRLELISGVLLGVVLGGLSYCLSSASWIVLGMLVLLDGDRWPFYSRLLTAGGRRARFLCTMVQLLLSGGVFTLSVILSFLAADALRGYLPGSTAWALAVEVGRFHWGLGTVLLVLAFIPLGCLAEMVLAHWFRRRDRDVWFGVYLLLVVVDLPGINVPLVWAALALVFSWVLCTVGVYRIAQRADLYVAAPSKPTFSSLWRTICEAAAGKQHRGVR